MEWRCASCGLCATADEWALLLSMGWRETTDGARRCSICVKKKSARLHSELPHPVQPVAVARRRGELR